MTMVDDPWDGTGPMRAAAEAYARVMDWRVCPVWWPRPDGQCACGHGRHGRAVGKHPVIANWPALATTDASTIRSWWDQWPMANIGIATGLASDLTALDVDPDHGGADSLADCVARYGPLPNGPVSLTGGGGQHVLFVAADRRANVIGFKPGLDFRADGGLIVAPPSRHASGSRYRWEVASHPLDHPLPTLPHWLRDALGAPAQTPAVRRTDDAAWLVKVLEYQVPEGMRNDTLARLMGHLLGHREDARLATVILTAVNSIACDPPLPQSEVMRIANSIAGRERQQRGGGACG